MISSGISLTILTVLLLLLEESNALISRCKIHADSTKAACKECYSPYSLIASGRCCDPSCIDCDEDLKCKNCKEGTFPADERCLSCGPGCEQCSGEFGCKYCADGYFLNTTTRCQPCMPGCLKCKNAEECMDCDGSVGSRYYQTGSKCEEYPQYCLDFNSVTKVCSLCPERMYLSQNKCNNCSENCKQCSQESCTACDEGFSKDNDPTSGLVVCTLKLFTKMRSDTDKTVGVITYLPLLTALCLLCWIRGKQIDPAAPQLPPDQQPARIPVQ